MREIAILLLGAALGFFACMWFESTAPLAVPACGRGEQLMCATPLE